VVLLTKEEVRWLVYIIILLEYGNDFI
jgi:hypothetical protein